MAKAFTITVQADTAPVAPSVPNLSAGTGSAWSYTVPAFTDADGDALTYSATNVPEGLAFNTSTRVISGTPTTVGTWTVKVTANDHRGSQATASFAITATAPQANRAPALTRALVNQYADTGIPFSYTFATDTFTDPDGNPLTYSALQSSGAALPTWLQFDAANRRFYGTPTGIATVTYTIRVTARDPAGLSTSGTFTLTKYGDSGSTRLMAEADPLSTDAPDGAVADSGVTDTTAEGSASGSDAPLPGTPEAMPPQASPVDGIPGRGIYRFDMGRARAPGQLRHGGADTDPGPAGEAAQPDATTAGTQSTLIATEPDGGTAGTTATTATLAPQVKDAWFTYDAENRIRISGGQLVAGQIVVAANTRDSYALGYDAVGHVTSRYVSYGVGDERVYRTAYDLRGHKALEFYYDKVGAATGSIQSRYSFDANGALLERRSYFAQGAKVDMGTDGEGYSRGKLFIGGWLSGASTYAYDADGRQLRQVTLTRDPATNWYRLSPEKNPDPDVAQTQSTDLTVLIRDSQVDYTRADGSSGYDALGRLTGYRYTADAIQWATHTYTSFSWRTALVQGAVGGATAGFGAAAKAGTFTTLLQENTVARAAAAAVVGGATSYAASRAVGAEAHFSWRAIAASAVTAAISTQIGEELGWNPTTDAGGSGAFWHDVGNGMVSGVVGLHVRRAMGFDDRVDYWSMAADAFGNAIGNAIVREVVSRPGYPVAGVSRGNISDRGQPAIGLHPYGGPYADEDAPQTIPQTLETIVVTGNGFAGTWSEYMAWLQVNHPDRYAQEQENDWAGRYNAYAAKYGYDPIPNGATSSQAREIYARTVAANQAAPLQAMAREAASLDHITAVMNAPPSKSAWDLLLEYNPGAVQGRMLAHLADEVALTFGGGDRVRNEHLGGMEYRVGPFTGEWHSPGDVQDAKFNVITSILSLGAAAPERILASELRAEAGAVGNLLGREVANVAGETAATATGKAVHARLAAERRASGQFDLVNQPFVDAAGTPLQVTKRVDLSTGQPLPQSGLQTSRPDAVRFQNDLILDDKPLGRPISKDQQEIIRFINAYQQSQGVMPATIGIQRYNPKTGLPVRTDLYSPNDFLPWLK